MNSTLPSLRVLVVENDEDTRTFFKLYLELLGHHADGVSGVGEALSALGQSSYDLLFVDIGLADGSGWDLMNIVRERGIAHPGYAVAMTGYGLPEDRARSEAAGFRHHLVKPFEPGKIKDLLDEALREAQARDGAG
jgi:two-component system CheB/CheR fusion protein